MVGVASPEGKTHPSITYLWPPTSWLPLLSSVSHCLHLHCMSDIVNEGPRVRGQYFGNRPYGCHDCRFFRCLFCWDLDELHVLLSSICFCSRHLSVLATPTPSRMKSLRGVFGCMLAVVAVQGQWLIGIQGTFLTQSFCASKL